MADFTYFNIMDIDPSFSALDEGVYTLRLNKIEGQEFTPQTGKRAGESTMRVNSDFAVVNHQQFSGRRLFHTFWLSNGFDQKALRRLADRTGVPQEPTDTFTMWLAKLTEQQPEVKVKVEKVPDVDYKTGNAKVDEITGKPLFKNVINWKEVQPAN